MHDGSQVDPTLLVFIRQGQVLQVHVVTENNHIPLKMSKLFLTDFLPRSQPERCFLVVLECRESPCLVWRPAKRRSFFLEKIGLHFKKIYINFQVLVLHEYYFKLLLPYYWVVSWSAPWEWCPWRVRSRAARDLSSTLRFYQQPENRGASLLRGSEIIKLS